MPITDARKDEIIKALKHCDDGTVAAALRLQAQADEAELNTVIRGVLARALPEERIGMLPEATDAARLIEDIGMDSFGMIEVVMTAEEVLGITISNEEMKGIATLGELKLFLQRKLTARAPELA